MQKSHNLTDQTKLLLEVSSSQKAVAYRQFIFVEYETLKAKLNKTLGDVEGFCSKSFTL